MRINKSYHEQFPNNCPLIETDGGGRSVGVCTYYAPEGICPRHGYWKYSVNPLYIVAGSYTQAKNIARLDFQMFPQQWRYVDDIDKLRGLVDFDLCFCVSYPVPENYERIVEYVSMMVSMDRVHIVTFTELNRRK